MSLRRTDLRFVLANPVARACVVGELPGWREGLVEAGVEVVGAGVRADLAVAAANRAAEAAASGADALLLTGGNPLRRPRLPGYAVQAYLALPRGDEPDVVLPLGSPTVARYVFEQWRPAETAVRSARNAVLARLAGMGTLPDPARVVLLAQRQPGPPAALRAAQACGVDPASPWFLSLGGGDRLSRAVFHAFPRGARQPAQVVKFARVPGNVAPFEREQQAYAMVARAGEVVAGQAPRLLGRFEVAGLPGSVETAASGSTLAVALRRSSREQGVRLVETVASWIVDAGRATAAAPQALAAELRRLAGEVLPAWRDQGAPADLVATLPAMPAVLQHNDLGTWNIAAGGAGFVVVDWESAREHGLPLWDLLYFLVDALARLDGARTPEQRTDHSLRLLRGELPVSAVLFRWVRRAAEAAAVPPGAVGAVATLCWLSHGLSHLGRGERADRLGAPGGTVPPVERIAPVWLTDPRLGPGWDRWRG